MQENHFDRLESENIDLRQVFRKTLPYWPWFVLALGIALVSAFFLIKSTPEKYISHATVLINKKGGNPSLDNLLLGKHAQTNMANEAGIIQSINLKKEALRYSNTGISYYVKNRYKTTAIYGEPPIKILFDSLHKQPVDVPIFIEPLPGKKIKISGSKEPALFYALNYPGNNTIEPFEIDTIIDYNDWIITRQLAFKVDSINFSTNENAYCFQVNSLQKQVSFYSELEVNIDKESTLMHLSLTSDHPEKAIDLLNGLIYAYQKSQVHKLLNEKAESIKFIDHLLVEVSDTLSTYENELTSFQTQNLAIGIDAKSQDLYNKYSSIKTELSKISLQQRYYKHVQELLKKEKKITDLISPSALGINEPIINDLVMQLVELYNQKTEAGFNTRKDNPMTSVIAGKIENLKASLELNIQNNLAALQLSKEEHKEQLKSIEGQLSKLPLTNKQLNAYERKFEIIDNLYTFLLKKRSEMRIEKSAIQPKNEVIQKAIELTTEKVGRSSVQILLIAIILALIIPFGIIQLKSILFNRIEDESQVQRYSNISIIGHVLRTAANKDNVFANPVSSAAEAFRTIRTNIHFYGPEDQTKIFLVTSTKQGEGKSFIAKNLAKAFACDNQKTILLNFDLRKPSSRSHGISTYLINKAEIKEIIQKNDDIDLIHSGPQPPNAAEIINNYRTGELFKYLKKKYDKIIIDSPPLVPISDASILSHYSDIQLFVIRLNYTPFDLFKQTIKKPIFRNFNKPLYIMNDIKPRNMYYSAYNYQGKTYGKKNKQAD